MDSLRRQGKAGRLSFLAKDTAIYGLGNAVNRALSLVTFPLLARHFSVADFGAIDLVTTAVALGTVLVIFGQDSSVARYFYEDENEGARRQLLSQSLAFQLGVMSIVTLVGLTFSGDIARLLRLEPEWGDTVVRLAVLQVPFFALASFSQGILKWTFRRWGFLTMSVGTALLTMLALLVAVFWAKLDVVGVFQIYLGVRIAFALLGLFLIRHWVTWPNRFDKLGPLTAFAAPYGLVCIITSFLPVFERTFVGALVGAQGLGIYAAGAKVAMLISLPINAIETSWGPFSVMLHKEANATETYNLALKFVTLLLMAAVLGLTGIGEWLAVFLGSDRFSGAGTIVFMLSMGLAIQSLGSMAGAGIVFSRRSYLLLAGYGALVVVAIVIIPPLARWLGIAGVAWGSLIAVATRSAVEAWLGQRAHAIAWDYRGPLFVIAATVMVGVALQMGVWPVKVAGFAVFPLVALVAIGIASYWLLFTASEREGARRLIADFRFKRTEARA